MRKLTLNEIWDYTKQMWKQIAFQKDVLKDPRSVIILKEKWLEENAPEFLDVDGHCFFCKEAPGNCNNCPGRLIDKSFDCCNKDYAYNDKPGAFYREILRLDEIRTAKLLEHVWEHGDVFSDDGGFYPKVYIHIKYDEPRVFHLSECSPNRGLPALGTTSSYTDWPEATFLFNIKDKLGKADS